MVIITYLINICYVLLYMHIVLKQLIFNHMYYHNVGQVLYNFFSFFCLWNLFCERMLFICNRVLEGVHVSTCLDVSSVVLANVLLCVWTGEGRFTLVVCG